jgi:hypothetical protein
MYTIAVCVTCAALVFAVAGVLFAITATFVAVSYSVRSAWSAFRTISQAWPSAKAFGPSLSRTLPLQSVSAVPSWRGISRMGVSGSRS